MRLALILMTVRIKMTTTTRLSKIQSHLTYCYGVISFLFQQSDDEKPKKASGGWGRDSEDEEEYKRSKEDQAEAQPASMEQIRSITLSRFRV